MWRRLSLEVVYSEHRNPGSMFGAECRRRQSALDFANAGPTLVGSTNPSTFREQEIDCDRREKARVLRAGRRLRQGAHQCAAYPRIEDRVAPENGAHPAVRGTEPSRLSSE